MWRLLQLADSAFPAGAFAHSFGLEAAAQAGEVPDVRAFAADAIWQAACGALPLARMAWSDLQQADERAEQFLVNHVANRASRVQGRAFHSTCVRIFGLAPVSARHLAPLWGDALHKLSVSLPDAQRLLLWSTARGVLSAAVRLGVAGTHEAQATLASLTPLLDEALSGAADLTGPCQTAPLVDLLQGTHDRLYSRLFQS